MKNCLTSVILGSLLIVSILTGCEKETQDFTPGLTTDYMNLQVGKYIRYMLDSTRFIAYGQKDTVVRYQAKDVVEDSITDNLGRPGFRIVRYLRDFKSTNDLDWKASLTYQVIPTRGTLEVIETNFRFIKLAQPIEEGYSWKGNRYLPTEPYQNRFEFNNDNYIDAWDYTYQDMGATLNINNVDYDNTITVFQVKDSTIIEDGLSNVNYWIEKYAKNVGLVYKEARMWEEQPTDSTRPAYRHGFGIKMTILDHN